MVGKEVEPSTITDIERLDRKLYIREQSEDVKPKQESLEIMPHSVKSFRDINGCNKEFPKVSQRRRPDIHNIGKDITAISRLVKAILFVRKKTERFKMLEEMRIDKMFKDFGNSGIQSNRMVVGRV